MQELYRKQLERSIGDGFFDSGAKFALFHYWSAHDVIAAGMKRAEPAAVQELARWLAGTLPQLEAWIRQAGCQYLVSPPGHEKGAVASSATTALGQLIAGHFPWLTHLPKAFRRTEKVPSYYRTRIRPGFARHVATIVYDGPRRPRGRGPAFLLFDDQATSGETSDACKAILARDAGASGVLCLFMSRSGSQRGLGRSIVRRA